MYRQVSILSQENKTSLRRVRDQRRVAARRRVCDSEAGAMACPSFLRTRENPRSVLEPRGLLTEYEVIWAQTVAPASGPAPRRAGFAVARPNRKVAKR